MSKRGPGAVKGEYRFKKYHEEKVSNTSKEIKKVLSLLKKSSVEFNSVTRLAKYVAEVIGNERGKPMAHTTLIRTPQYRYMLDQYMERNVVSTKSVSRVTENFRKEIKEMNLEEENARLRSFIERNLGGSPESVKSLEAEEENNKREVVVNGNGEEVYKLCDLIKTLVDNSEGIYEVRGGKVYANIIGREVASDDVQKPFTKWYKERYPD
ncbi:hypothetical protein DFO67_11712 [Modicisalibacter xianhensis]|uniref:Uncharacterized protein n=1 Tax=Modicisalibacter xianhensis TaxID=442341 RepID=A0A4R8FIS4_9GAMM|nr:hypothetical protein [Halomonas xianhensis]TDX26030.1 hypothetical protein DFO67_11712 [Halomonas xianhensis]